MLFRTIFTYSILLTSLLVGCVHAQSTIVPFPGADKSTSESPSPLAKESVAIYLGHGPYKTYTELGLITYRAYAFDISSIYGQLRKDAAKSGAEAVIDLKIKDETHSETVPQEKCLPKTNCDINGVCITEQECHTEFVTQDVTTFFCQGTLIRSQQ